MEGAAIEKTGARVGLEIGAGIERAEEGAGMMAGRREGAGTMRAGGLNGRVGEEGGGGVGAEIEGEEGWSEVGGEAVGRCTEGATRQEPK